MIKCLLISPKDPETPKNLKYLVGGENTYTQSLLSHPPDGVQYIHRDKALSENFISTTFWHGAFGLLFKLRVLPPDAGFVCIQTEKSFDLIHSHAYGLKINNKEIPVVLSDSSSNVLFLRDYLGWSKQRIQCQYSLKRFVVKNFDIYDSNLNLENVNRLIVWSEFAKRIHIELGADPSKIEVIPPGIPCLPYPKEVRTDTKVNILLIGIWFERKGGQLLLQAYKRLKKKYPYITLTLVGKIPPGTVLPPDTRHASYVPREKLYKDIFPQADVLVLVPPVAEGYGIVVLEAMSLGIPAIVTNVYAFPEIVKDNKTGYVI